MKEVPPADLGHTGANILDISVDGLEADQAVARLLDHAAELGVSDLFFLARENSIAVQARHLGIVRLVTIVPMDFGRRCMSHIKAVAGMDVAERRRPLDGRCIFRRPRGSTIDLRISTLPTLYGEDFTIRLLVRDSQLLSLDQLGLLPHDFSQLLSLISTPAGLLLVTGPTGAGKTTTLYACLAHLNNGERKINTIEDPIEYALPGVRQAQVNTRLEVGFPELLRTVLRQAPDVIMIGEVRDPDTAQTAVRAAVSGHLVLATLHAPIAAGAVQTMLSLGVHPHFLAASLLGVLAQRLVRTVCPKCAVPFDVAPEMFVEVERWLGPEEGKKFYGPAPKGCPECRGLSYRGRTGVFEVLHVTKAVRKAILERQPTQAIHQQAVREGMIEFRHSALLKVARGETSLEEVFRTVPSEYLGVED
jgi:type II secretory ATPase GspE/PulE/Tfp pilus assembly ATPase PilB-like protein